MTDLENIEKYLNIDTDLKKLRPGKNKSDKNRFFYYPGQYYIVQLSNTNWMISSDTPSTRKLLRKYIWTVNKHGYTVTRVKTLNGMKIIKYFHKEVMNMQNSDNENMCDVESDFEE